MHAVWMELEWCGRTDDGIVGWLEAPHRCFAALLPEHEEADAHRRRAGDAVAAVDQARAAGALALLDEGDGLVQGDRQVKVRLVLDLDVPVRVGAVALDRAIPQVVRAVEDVRHAELFQRLLKIQHGIASVINTH